MKLEISGCEVSGILSAGGRGFETRLVGLILWTRELDDGFSLSVKGERDVERPAICTRF